MELYKASSQWSSRPDDERFWTIAEMRQACESYARSAVTATVLNQDLRIEPNGADLTLIGKAGYPAILTHHAFGQICQRTHSPAGFLRELPPTLAANTINYRLKHSQADGTSKLLMHKPNGDGAFLLRGVSSELYRRVWNYSVCGWLERAQDSGWRVPPAYAYKSERSRPATEADVIPGFSRIKVGDMIGPSGLYASDHDMFGFMINPDVQIEAGNGRTLCRGFFVWNAEVSGVSLGATSFLFDQVCGNHIVWGAQDVRELRMRHVGKIGTRGPIQLIGFMRQQSELSAYDEEQAIKKAQIVEVGKNPNEVIEWMFSKLTITKKQAGDAYAIAELEQDSGNPRSAWGVVQGLTRLSQRVQFADERVALDRAAGKVMEVAF